MDADMIKIMNKLKNTLKKIALNPSVIIAYFAINNPIKQNIEQIEKATAKFSDFLLTLFISIPKLYLYERRNYAR